MSASGGGTWGTAENVPGLGALGVRGFAETKSVSCAAPGDCSAGGTYSGSFTGERAFVVSEVNGIWGVAQKVPGLAGLNGRGDSQIDSVSCAAPGDCSAGGSFNRGSAFEAFVVTEANGTWGQAEVVPGSIKLNRMKDAVVGSVSCAAPGDCSAGGFYTDHAYQSFVVSQQHGVWGSAEQVAGTAEPDNFWGGLTSVSCAAPGDCAAGGYNNNLSTTRAYVVNETAGP